jgi:hypothetical protein
MSEPTQPPPVPPAVPEVPAEDSETVAARALAVLVEVVRTEPLLNRLALARPMYHLYEGRIDISVMNASAGREVLAAIGAFFGGDVKVKAGGTYEDHVLTTVWQHLPLQVTVPIAREDETAAFRKRVAELEAAESMRLQAGRLAEQRHQVADPAVPDPAAYIAALLGVSR